MAEVRYIADDGAETVLDVSPGNNLMMAAVFDGITAIEGICGGCLSCASCHVYVDPAWLDRLPPPSDDEVRMLGEVAAERRPNSRLSCQIEMREDLAGIVVTMPDRQI
jgi:2Fe-2S ferredoxin